MSVEIYAYTEVDTNGWLTVAQSLITAASMQNESNAYVYRDMGAGGISGNFVCTLETAVTAVSGSSSFGGVWGYANVAGNYASWDGGAYVDVHWIGTRLVIEGGALFDLSSALSLSTTYYLTIKRVGLVVTCYIYSDEDRETLVDSISTTLTVASTYRYAYAAFNYDENQAGRTISYTVENLDIGLNPAPDITGVSGDGRRL